MSEPFLSTQCSVTSGIKLFRSDSIYCSFVLFNCSIAKSCPGQIMSHDRFCQPWIVCLWERPPCHLYTVEHGTFEKAEYFEGIHCYRWWTLVKNISHAWLCAWNMWMRLQEWGMVQSKHCTMTDIVTTLALHQPVPRIEGPASGLLVHSGTWMDLRKVADKRMLDVGRGGGRWRNGPCWTAAGPWLVKMMMEVLEKATPAQGEEGQALQKLEEWQSQAKPFGDPAHINIC